MDPVMSLATEPVVSLTAYLSTWRPPWIHEFHSYYGDEQWDRQGEWSHFGHFYVAFSWTNPYTKLKNAVNIINTVDNNYLSDENDVLTNNEIDVKTA